MSGPATNARVGTGVFLPRARAPSVKTGLAEGQVITNNRSPPVTTSQCELEPTKTGSRDAASSLENLMANSCSGYSPSKSQGCSSSSCSPVGSARSPTTSSQLTKQQLLMPQQTGISTAQHNTAQHRSISLGASQMTQRLLPAGGARRKSFHGARNRTEAAYGACPDRIRPAQRRPASSSGGTTQQQGDYGSSWSSVMFGPHTLSSSPRTSSSPVVPLQLPADLRPHTSTTSHSSPAPASVTSVTPTQSPCVSAAWCGVSCGLQQRRSPDPLWVGLPGRQGVYTDTPDPVSSSSGPWCNDWPTIEPCQGIITEAAAADLGPAPHPCSCQPVLPASQQLLLLEQEQQLFLQQQQQQLFLQQQQQQLFLQQQQQQQWAMPNSPPAAPALATLLQLHARLAAAKQEAADGGGGGGCGQLEQSLDHNPCSTATARDARTLTPMHVLAQQQQHLQQQQQILGVDVPAVLPANTPGAVSSSSGVLPGLSSADLVMAPGDAQLTAAGHQGSFYGSSWPAGAAGRRATSDLLPGAFTAAAGSAGPLPSLQSGPLLLSQPIDLLSSSSPIPPLAVAGSVRAAASGSRRRVTISGDGSDTQVAAAAAAALATDRLARLEDLRALQQQLMDEVITLLPLI